MDMGKALELTDTAQHQMNGRLGSTPIQKKPQSCSQMKFTETMSMQKENPPKYKDNPPDTAF